MSKNILNKVTIMHKKYIFDFHICKSEVLDT